jgi:hypothetical protein
MGAMTAVAAGIALMLVGCSSKDHVSARLKDGVIEFVVCSDVTVNRVQVQSAPAKGGDHTYSVDWNVDGTGILASGTCVKYGIAPKGFNTTSGPTNLSVNDLDLFVTFQNIDESNPKHVTSSQSGIFNGAKLRKDRWLNWNAQLVDSPC